MWHRLRQVVTLKILRFQPKTLLASRVMDNIMYYILDTIATNLVTSPPGGNSVMPWLKLCPFWGGGKRTYQILWTTNILTGFTTAKLRGHLPNMNVILNKSLLFHSQEF